MTTALKRFGFSILAAACLTTGQVRAEYPDRPIKVIVGYAAGGGTDLTARAIAARLSDILKQPVVVDNRPGASGMIGSNLVAKAKPDGYTIQLAIGDTHSINPHAFPNIAYDAKKDFVPVAQIGYFPLALLVSSKVTANTVKEFIEYTKQPGKSLTYSSWGPASSGHVAMEMLKTNAGIDMLHIPYQGAAPAIAAVLSGEVDAMLSPMTLAAAYENSDKLKILGIAASTRYPGLPNVSTFDEQGVRLNMSPVWAGVMAPAGTPAEAVNRLSWAVGKVLEDPKVEETLLKAGLTKGYRSSEAFKPYFDAEYKRWGDVIRRANIKAQ
ncbi:tripartite tricarboxylate transporter substrate binding protein [Variovorax paradoxus]|nr:tripartite tricarboxylate transporter substrate binding protein [Variovorax paradoxus]MBT2304844.1 tripartite tricarboxylate transporter substrate binding protein [Variovorax paradoxus]